MSEITLFDKILHKINLCNWNVIKTMGYNKYIECDICNKRDVVFLKGGYTPLDREWLNNGSLKYAILK